MCLIKSTSLLFILFGLNLYQFICQSFVYEFIVNELVIDCENYYSREKHLSGQELKRIT